MILPMHSQQQPTRESKCHKHGGFSLIEVLVSTVILVAVMIPMLSALGSIAKSYSQQSSSVLAASAADALLAEVLGHSFEDIDTFNGVVIEDGDDTPSQHRFIRTISVVFATAAEPNQLSQIPTNVKRITIEVNGSNLPVPVHVVAIKTQPSDLEMSFANDTSQIESASVTLKVDRGKAVTAQADTRGVIPSDLSEDSQ